MNCPIYYYTVKHLDSSHWPKSASPLLCRKLEFSIGFRKFLMLIQEKQFLHQQHLGTCVNNMFLYTDLFSAQQHVFLSLGEDTGGKCIEEAGREWHFPKDLDSSWQRSIFLRKLSNQTISPGLHLFLLYKFGLIFYHLIDQV